MTVVHRKPSLLTINPNTGVSRYIDVTGAVVRIDDRAIPRVTIDMTIPAPDAATEALFDPAAGQIVGAYTTYAGADTAYPYDYGWLGYVSSTRRNLDGTLQVTAVSCDVRLLEYSPAVVDEGCKALQSDLRLIWQYVLNKVYGGTTQDGWWIYLGPDGDLSVPPTPFPTYRAATNLVPNPGFEYGVTGWTAAQSSIAVVTTQRRTGAYSLQITPSSSLNTSRATIAMNLQPNTTYTLSAWVRQSAVMGSSANAQRCTLKVSANVSNVVQDLVASDAPRNVANTWTRVSVTFTMPALADAGSVLVQMLNGTSNSAPVTVWWDDVMVVEGDGIDTDGTSPIPSFDGDTVDGTNGYNYAWQGTPGSSSSTRTPIIDRDPDILTWSPGQTAYDFLQPLMEAFGYRTVAGDFYPANGRNAIVPGLEFVTSAYTGNRTGISQIAQGRNLYSVETGKSRSDTFPDGTPLFADAVIIKYTWTDNLGIEHVAYDAHAPAGYVKPYFLEVNEPFAGPGRAKSLFARLVARRSIYQATYRLNVIARPSMQVSITSDLLPGGAVLGQADTVEHDIVNGTTTITTKNTVAYPASAWLRLPAGESWNASPTGASWTAEPIS